MLPSTTDHCRASTSRSVTWSALQRAGRVAAAAPLLASTLSGCHTYARVDSQAPAAGEFVAAEITDQGRVALADSLGRSPGQVEGRLVSNTDSSITLAVTAVRTLQGERTNWAGERVTLRRTSVGQVTQRRLSVGRSLLAGALALGAAVAIAVGLGLDVTGDGGEGDRTNPPPTGEQ